ncbi:uncharacterized protein LOC115764217 [Drosophila novamexicana]|uniref:uncharacterized protein LOC115764217 n=1 Tax=Drosophila novamexicana TaxID=47314 RepID=UPI0011E5973D|nr:uncharacterized protein LOC115764217 [Drosophila novamexicana]
MFELIVELILYFPFPLLAVTQHVHNCGPQTFLISRKGGTLLTINNFVYRSNLKFYGKSNDILYWECVQNRSMKCRSRLKTIGDDLYVTNDVHNHMGDTKRIEAAKASGMLIHKKLSSLTAADRIHGWNRADSGIDQMVKFETA